VKRSTSKFMEIFGFLLRIGDIVTKKKNFTALYKVSFCSNIFNISFWSNLFNVSFCPYFFYISVRSNFYCFSIHFVWILIIFRFILFDPFRNVPFHSIFFSTFHFVSKILASSTNKHVEMKFIAFVSSFAPI
jgi:hypothetical protein